MLKWRGCLFIVLRIPWLVQSCIQSSKFHLQTTAPFACRTAFLLSEWWWCLIRQGEGLPHVKYLAFVYPPKQEKGRMYSISMWNGGSACCCLLCTTKWSTTGYTLKKKKKKKRYLQTNNIVLTFGIKSAQYTEICEVAILTERIQLKKKTHNTMRYEI